MDNFETTEFQMYWVQLRVWLYLFVGGGFFLGLSIFLSKGFVSIPEGHAMVLIRKTGLDLKSGQIIALNDKQKGIQLPVSPEGWYFLNPYVWDFRIVRKIEIPEGRLGVQIRLFGKPLRKGQVIAGSDQKGILRDILMPGRHMINPYAYRIELHKKILVPPGYMGVVILKSGKMPKDSNVFITKDGERGVQRKTLGAGSYYVNPYIQKVVPVDVRAHKFEMYGEDGIKFPSKDGFQISMDGTIEWYIDQTRVSEVYVKYVDSNNVLLNIVQKIVLPYARAYGRIEGSKYLARDFIGGKTREAFQARFLHELQRICGAQGIIIRSALIKNVVPPQTIVEPIKNKEITKRLREKYKQQMKREIQQKRLSIKTALQTRAQKLMKTQADVSVAITNALRKKEVAIINAKKKLQYAKLRLQAAQNLAQIILAKGRASAKVIRLNNKANAEGIRNAAKAFGSGDEYVRYLFYRKLAPSYRYILSNTSGPFMKVFLNLAKDTVLKKNMMNSSTKLKKTQQKSPKALSKLPIPKVVKVKVAPKHIPTQAKKGASK